MGGVKGLKEELQSSGLQILRMEELGLDLGGGSRAHQCGCLIEAGANSTITGESIQGKRR